MLLRRGGAKPGNAVVVAVCESEEKKPEKSYKKAKDDLVKLPKRLMIKVKTNNGIDSNQQKIRI